MKTKRFQKACFTQLVILLLIAAPGLLQAQSRHGLFNLTEVGYGKGIGRIDYGEMGKRPNEGRMGRLRTTFGHYLTPNLSLGAGIGLDGYTGSTGPRYNTLPVYVDVRAYLKEAMSAPFAFVDAGHTVKMGDQFTSGAFGAVGVGYKKGFSGWGSFLVSAGVNMHQIKDDETLVLDNSTGDYYYIKNDLALYSLSINVGLLLK